MTKSPGKVIAKEFATVFGNNNNNNIIISRDSAFLTVRCISCHQKNGKPTRPV